MIAQDTGSAIIGPARGDIFFGSGRGGRLAGRPGAPFRDDDRARFRERALT